MTNNVLEKKILALKGEISANKKEGVAHRIEVLLQESRDFGDEKLIGDALMNKTAYLRHLGELEEAIHYLKEAQKYYNNSNNPQLEASVLNERGTAYLDLGQDDQGIECFFRGLKILNKEKAYEVTRTLIMNNLGTAYYDLEDYDKAKNFFHEAYDIIVQEKTMTLLPVVTFNLAECYFCLGQFEQCDQWLVLSKKVSIEAEDEIGLVFAKALREILDYEENQDETELLKCFYESRKVLEQLDVTSVTEVSNMFCQTLYKHKNWQLLKPILEEVYSYAVERNFLSHLYSIRKMLREIYIDEGDYQSAYRIIEVDMASTVEKVKRLESKQYSQIEMDYKQISSEHYVDSLEDSVRVFKLLSEVGHGITLNKDIEGIFEYIAEHIYSIWDLDIFGLAILDEEENNIRYHYNTIEEGNRVNVRSRWNESVLMNYCINNNTEIVIKDANVELDYKGKYPQEITEQIKESSVRSLIFTPMLTGDKVVGGITVQSKNPYYFNSGSIEVVRTFAAYCSTAIVNHQRHLKLQKMKDLDGLTGVYNRHALINFNSVFDNNPEEKAMPMFIGMLDIDYFKEYNDYYGHIAGDQCIVEIVQMIADQVSHIGGEVFRYGGDEFNVIIDGCDEAKAKELLESILSKLSDMDLKHKESKVSDQVTLSIGGLVINKIVKKSIHYYEDVDKILYEVKNQGRNGYKIMTT